mmetsp:Transcript_23756/g.44372  ORF Transcript_23756/g.44372 Transcript_23756/m.44372 type:complete len:228 (-) Transcript_23756:275-958(-)
MKVTKQFFETSLILIVVCDAEIYCVTNVVAVIRSRKMRQQRVSKDNISWLGNDLNGVNVQIWSGRFVQGNSQSFFSAFGRKISGYLMMFTREYDEVADHFLPPRIQNYTNEKGKLIRSSATVLPAIHVPSVSLQGFRRVLMIRQRVSDGDLCPSWDGEVSLSHQAFRVSPAQSLAIEVHDISMVSPVPVSCAFIILHWPSHRSIFDSTVNVTQSLVNVLPIHPLFNY